MIAAKFQHAVTPRLAALAASLRLVQQLRMDALACDTFRASASYRRRATWRLFVVQRTFRPVVTLRWCQASRGPLRILAKVAHRLSCQRAGIDFPQATSVGAGLAITHGWGLVVSAGATIGRNVTLFHGVTIGQADRIAHDGTRTSAFPVIGDSVWIGPHAVIVGGVTIGAGARIMANSVVTADVPAAALVGGNPAAVLRENVAEDVMNKVPHQGV